MKNQISLAETVGDEIKFSSDDLIELINEINTELVETIDPSRLLILQVDMCIQQDLNTECYFSR